jgi:fructose-bisphosphate aldolase class 1
MSTALAPHSSGVTSLARVQDEGLMPIVEPDISLSGDYDLETAVEVCFCQRLQTEAVHKGLCAES